MKKYFNEIRKDKLVVRLFLLSLIIAVVSLLFILFSYTKLPPLIPIYNQLPWGQERLTITPGIFIPVILITSILIINFLVAAVIYVKYPLIARLFAITTLLTSFLTLLFVIRTITLII
jgi:hypothetical protein